MVYARRVTRPKPRRAESMMFPAPVGGWISNRSLALPQGATPGAAVMDNYFPRAGTVKLRRGKQLYATLQNTTIDVTALFSYRNGNNEKLFGANANTIYDLTSIPFPEASEIVTENDDLIVTEDGDWFGWSSTDGYEVATGLTGGDWSVVQFATTGGVYLVGVNGENAGFIYDGTGFWPNLPGGYYSLEYDGLTTSFSVGEIVTGATSGAVGKVQAIKEDSPTEGLLYISAITGTFQAEAITGSVAGAANALGAQVMVSPGVTFGSLTSADMSFVFTYKSRLFFIEKESLNVWYMAPDQIGGTATLFPMAGIFDLGGSILFGQGWSLTNSDSGGLSEQCVFVTTEGQAVIYQGDDPNTAASWSKVGVYRIGRPLGKRAFFRGGGDLAIATSVGLVPLSKAIELDITSLNVATVSYNIADAWADAVSLRGQSNWACELWPESKMALVSPPDPVGATSPVLFVSNSETGAWCRFTGWQVRCMEVFRGQLYFGSPNGQVFIANVGGSDNGQAYTGVVIPMFQDMGTPMSRKFGGMVRAVSRANTQVNAKCGINFDFNETPPVAPNAGAQVSGSLWGTAIWGQSKWGDFTPTVINQSWQSGGGLGYVLAPTYQVTSGSIGPFDDELIRMELSYTVSEIVT